LGSRESSWGEDSIVNLREKDDKDSKDSKDKEALPERYVSL